MKEFLMSIIVFFAGVSVMAQQKGIQQKLKVTDTAGYQKGLMLITKSDCATCHKPVDKAIGPSFEAISEKYPYSLSAIILLAQKIQKGGKGNWGVIPMVSHSSITTADAKKMARSILLFKNSVK